MHSAGKSRSVLIDCCLQLLRIFARPSSSTCLFWEYLVAAKWYRYFSMWSIPGVYMTVAHTLEKVRFKCHVALWPLLVCNLDQPKLKYEPFEASCRLAGAEVSARIRLSSARFLGTRTQMCEDRFISMLLIRWALLYPKFWFASHQSSR